MNKIIKLTESDLTRIVRRVIKEQAESGSTESYTISDVQQVASQAGSNLNVAKYADPSCSCAPKLTGDSEKDNLIKKAYRWAQNQTIGSLWNELKSLRQKRREAKKAKKEGKLQEQAVLFTVLGLSITASTLIAIGAILLFIILAIILIKSGKKKGGCGGPGWWNDL